jgi:uncharacterized membrane protein YsdA (DUF1294 family)/cold shock CspA family protein
MEAGTLKTWNDEKGFGFIAPSSAGKDVFIHAKSFANRQRRPSVDDRVQYLVEKDATGRPQATGVLFQEESAAVWTWLHTRLFIAGAFILIVLWQTVQNALPTAVIWFYLVASPITFVTYGWDKSAAKSDRRRIPENTLHFLELIGGWPGALIAQEHFHHKSRKLSYQFVYWLCVICNCVVLYLLF